MGKLKRHLSSIRVSLIVCIVVTLLAAQGLYLLSLGVVDNAMMDLMDPRPDALLFDNGSFVTVHYGETEVEWETQVVNERAFDFLRSFRTFLPALIYGLLIVGATLLYYYIKLRRPLNLLERGIGRIADKELDFTIETPSGDELGRLCGAFERMRAELQQTFQDLWQSEENQRSLYRAFAHDLRTPLTIIKGNNDIIELVAAKNGDWGKALDAVSLSNNAIGRIEQYAEQLQQLENLDDWQPVLAACSLEALMATVSQEADILGSKHGKQVAVSIRGQGPMHIDQNGVMRIIDNILLNALQHATTEVAVLGELDGRNLSITVRDDGPGFSPAALKRATTPFWSSDKSGGHIGVGLTIASSMVEKCCGSLQLGNNEGKGAFVRFQLPV